MNLESRTKNTIKNIKFSLLNQFIILVFSFIIRTIFIKELGINYLGINGLFGSVITLLTMLDLGITSTMAFSLYEPLVNKNMKKINLLIKFYSKIYYYICLIVLILGLLMIPFLKYIIKDFIYNRFIITVYIIFIIDVSLNYLFIYKKCLIISDQKNYIISNINNAFFIILSIAQIAILIFTKSYILFLLIKILINLIQNFYINYIANKLYPCLKIKVNDKLDKNTLKEINKNIRGTFFYQISDVISNGTDNIILSKFIGFTGIGLYSNYTLISNAVNGVLYYIFDSMMGSLGNLAVKENLEKTYKIFKVTNFINFWLFGLCFVCLVNLINPFISLWLGKSYLLDFYTVIIIGINFYINGMRNTNILFRRAYGLLSNGKIIPIIMSISNLILSIILVNIYGIKGVIIGTIISTLITYSWYDPYIVLNVKLKKSFIKYLYTNLFYGLITLITLFIVNYLSYFWEIHSFTQWTIKAVCIFILVNIIFTIFTFYTDEFKYGLNLFINIILKNKKI
ncbi:lipopolysaccharide biosynthesis protein [Clostridium perfringens]